MSIPDRRAWLASAVLAALPWALLGVLGWRAVLRDPTSSTAFVPTLLLAVGSVLGFVLSILAAGWCWVRPGANARGFLTVSIAVFLTSFFASCVLTWFSGRVNERFMLGVMLQERHTIAAVDPSLMLPFKESARSHLGVALCTYRDGTDPLEGTTYLSCFRDYGDLVFGLPGSSFGHHYRLTSADYCWRECFEGLCSEPVLLCIRPR